MSYREIDPKTYASIQSNDSLPIPMDKELAHDCGCALDFRLGWMLCPYHLGFEDGLSARNGAR